MKAGLWGAGFGGMEASGMVELEAAAGGAGGRAELEEASGWKMGLNWSSSGSLGGKKRKGWGRGPISMDRAEARSFSFAHEPV